MRRVILVALGVLWLVVSVPVGIAVSRVLKARREEMEETDRQSSVHQARREAPSWDRQARRVPQSSGHRDRQDHR